MDSKAEPERWEPETSQERAVTACLSITETHGSKDPATAPTKSRMRDFLRHNRLQFLGKIFIHWLNWIEEPRKVVLHRSRKVAAYHCLLHLIPLSGAITLLILRWTHYWIGFNPPAPTTLQFVAKLHELFMQVSIVEIVLCIVRTEAIYGFVPLGALSGALQATQLSFLWSLDFWSMLYLDMGMDRQRRLRRVAIVAAIPTLLILTALVGPSSAVLMMPEPGSPKLDREFTTALGPSEFLFPTHLDVERGLNMTGMEWNFTQLVYHWLNSRLGGEEQEHRAMFEEVDDTRMTRETMLRYLYEGTAPDPDIRTGFVVEAIAAMPTAFATHFFDGWGVHTGNWERPYYNSTVSVTMPHPMVKVRCYENYDSRAEHDIKYVSDSDGSLKKLENLGSWIGRVGSPDLPNGDTRSSERIFDPVWLASPEKDSHNLIGVFLSSTSNKSQTVNQILDAPPHTGGHIKIKCCSLSAYWITAESISIVDGTELRRYAGYIQTGKLAALDLYQSKRITLNVTGWDVLWNPQFSSMLSRFSYPTGLAGAFTFALSQVPTNILRSQSNATRTTMKASNNNLNAISSYTMYGYGYSEDSMAIRLSLTVISAYCLVTVAYMLYVLISGYASTAWNSPIEVVALALQSKQPDYPDQGHTAAGIDSVSTLRQNVGIRVNTNNELGLVFANDRNLDWSELRKIEKDKAY